jgi:hypothetical protein
MIETIPQLVFVLFAHPKFYITKEIKMPAGRPRTSSPEKEELIELGKDLVEWASEKKKKDDPIRVRFCDWYTDRGFIRKQWEDFRDKPEFSWYYEKARSLMALRYVDGTVNQSIAHRYLRIYDPEMKDSEDSDLDAAELRKARSLKSEAKAIEEERLKVLDEVQRNKRTPQ